MENTAATRLNEHFPFLPSDVAPSSDLIPPAFCCAVRLDGALAFFSPLSFCPRKAAADTNNKMRFHNETRGAVIWTSGAEPRQTVSFPSAPAPAAIWPETCPINTTRHNLITITPLPDGKSESDGGRTRSPPLHLIHSGTFTPGCRSRLSGGITGPALITYTAAAGPRRRRLQKLEVVAFSNNSVQKSTEGSQLFCQISFF